MCILTPVIIDGLRNVELFCASTSVIAMRNGCKHKLFDTQFLTYIANANECEDDYFLTKK